MNKNKTNKKIFFSVFTVFLIVLGTVSAERMLEIDIDVAKDNTIVLNALRIVEGNPSFYIAPGDYRIEIFDSKGELVFEQSYKLSFTLFSDPPMEVNVSSLYLKVGYTKEMNKLVLYNKEKVLLEKDIIFCDNNKFCDTEHENYLSCPEDCPLDVKDAICIKKQDGACDPDCVTGADPDCDKEESLLDSQGTILIVGIVVFIILIILFLHEKLKSKDS